MSGLVVVDKQVDWPASLPGVDVVTATEYLTEDNYTRRRGMRVYNLCRSFAYQSNGYYVCLLYTSPSPRDRQKSRMPSSA